MKKIKLTVEIPAEFDSCFNKAQMFVNITGGSILNEAIKKRTPLNTFKYDLSADDPLSIFRLGVAFEKLKNTEIKKYYNVT